MAKNLTLHIISNVPYSNLNRDDSGTPKRLMLGGALRAMHSSQSIKRGIRGKYEEASLDLSVRSGKLVDEVLDIATKLNPEIEKESLRKPAAKRIGELTKSEAAEKESDRSAWLSVEELTTLAQSLIDGEENNEYIADGKTGSLAIAAFGRMFANAPEKILKQRYLFRLELLLTRRLLSQIISPRVMMCVSAIVNLVPPIWECLGMLTARFIERFRSTKISLKQFGPHLNSQKREITYGSSFEPRFTVCHAVRKTLLHLTQCRALC